MFSHVVGLRLSIRLDQEVRTLFSLGLREILHVDPIFRNSSAGEHFAGEHRLLKYTQIARQ